MRIVSVEDGVVQVEIPPEEALGVTYDTVRGFVLAEAGHEIAEPDCVEERIDLAIGKPGTVTWYCPF